jgi:hypothetical protein
MRLTGRSCASRDAAAPALDGYARYVFDIAAVAWTKAVTREGQVVLLQVSRELESRD